MESLFTIDPFDQFKIVLQEVFSSLCQNDERTHSSDNSNIIEAAKHEIEQLIIKTDFNIDEVAVVIKSKSWDQDKIDYFLTVLQQQRIEVLYALLTHNNSTHGEILMNFNWALKLVLGSSELKSLKYPVLQLMLDTKTSNFKSNQKIYELNKESLNKLITALENIV